MYFPVTIYTATMKKFFLLMLLATAVSCQDKPLKPPFVITGMHEGDGCCDITFRDSVGNTGWRCTPFGNFHLYKIGDTLK